MKKYKITVTNGKYNAPALYVEAADHKEAAELARLKSGLGRFENWLFIPKSI